MKNIYRILIIAFFFICTSISVNAAISYSLDARCGTSQLVVLVTPNINYSGGNAIWTPAVFTVRYPMTLGNGILSTVTNQNGFSFAAAGALGNDGTYYYQKYAHTANTTLAMTSGTSYEVTRITLVGAYGVYGNFEIPASDNPWIQPPNNGISVFSNPSGNQVPSTYSAYALTNVPLFAGIFWDGVSWCGGSGTSEQPGAADGTLACYVNGMGAVLTTPVATPAVVNKLIINTGSQLTINPGAALTVSDSTIIKSPQGLVVAANAGGTGSFKNFYDVTKTIYLSGGSATVQAYLLNTQSTGTFHIHLIGPPVFDPAIAIPPTTGPGYVPLSAFNILTTGTYAYRYVEPTNSWLNIYQLTDSIPRLGGIALSDISGSSKTIALTGRLNTGSVNQPTTPTKWAKTLTAGQGEGLYLFSNPYACGLKLSQFYNDNIAPTNRGLNSNFWSWEELSNNYGTYYFDVDNEIWTGTLNLGTANGIISPAQGFFGQMNSVVLPTVRTLSGAAGDLERVHIYTPFLKTTPLNFLRLMASGNNSNDELIIKFHGNASPGFEPSRDIGKWFSMSDQATEINTVSVDQYLLTVNSLPLLQPGEMTNVPMDFKCGAEGTYNITASNIESFEVGTEIWLEDIKVGGEWYSLNINPVYEFTGSPSDEISRFIIHFFGSTGIDDPITEQDIQIYGYGRDAYIVNRGTETIKEYIAYDMMGRELHRGTLPNSTVNKVTIGDASAYYIVKVITKEGHIYTDKVYITK